MSNQNAKGAEASSSKFSSLFAAIVIPLAIVVGYFVFKYILGNPIHFEGGDPNGHPIPGDYLGMMYKGGILVPVLMGMFMIVLAVIIERFFTINAASGKGSIPNFVRKIKQLLDSGSVDQAISECDRQKGSVANVIREGLTKYKEMAKATDLDKDHKVLAIQKEIEESTSLELPMLEKNLVILATISSVATLFGLLGTVFGMIRAFSAIATAGAPDAVALSTGISEALINTALGISTSALAIISYNYYTTKIDGLTYGIDEAGFTISQSFASKHS
ncbi:MAG: MotA/TolQ/ExbB proton channel family protein [Saprospiraceae bacterium]|nr:MotA/TolQ/ExbB proton channel family protein [Saprospiraceae bacterium]MBK8485070.1 MotA/TolQ/ExbB proton channel family protein [Saprospiraceae bacterium]MBK9223128.1 MotA/TolQ/ExbB proton channel family protein [Saprospiraceae bacterium]MBK9720658.1 MotA/TolQ/ExbB proton channel family protein [Saprospiraceae bacterium]MBK9727647.1 MotA/TolQ/ExbB proton channel family protein [Saprospiraceae bacterium]